MDKRDDVSSTNTGDEQHQQGEEVTPGEALLVGQGDQNTPDLETYDDELQVGGQGAVWW